MQDVEARLRSHSSPRVRAAASRFAQLAIATHAAPTAHAPAAPTPEHRAPCVHRGELVRRVQCRACELRTGLANPVPVYSCALHKECTLIKTGKPIRGCNVCSDHAAANVSRLAALTSYFNPAGYHRLRENYERFRAAFAAFGVPLFTAELAFDDRPFELADATLQVRGDSARHRLWQKERLLNLLADRVPQEFDALAWIDADVLFFNPDWPAQTLAELRQMPVVQLFEKAQLLDPSGNVAETWTSCGKTGDPDPRRSHPGFAWAARRDVFPLYDHHVTGGGDVMMLKAWRSAWEPLQMNSEWHAHWRAWGARHEGRGVGYVPGTIAHMFHGSRANRKYLARLAYLTDNRFDPPRDLRIDANGLWTWTDEAIAAKPRMAAAVSGYFNERKEDA